MFWLKDVNLIDLDNLPDPEDLINYIIEDIESALVKFKTIKIQLVDFVKRSGIRSRIGTLCHIGSIRMSVLIKYANS